MFFYYLRLGAMSVQRHPLLTGLMLAAIAIGIGACMTVVTIYHVMSGNPIPHKSDQLYYVQLDNWNPHEPNNDYGLPPDQLTYRDATTLLAAAKARRQVVSYQIGHILEPESDEQRPFQVEGRATSADFFAMFDVPFRYGGGWDQAADDGRERVAVIRRSISERLFGERNPVGDRIRMNGDFYRITGVLDEWDPVPRFYDLTTSEFNNSADVFIPFNVAVEKELSGWGNTNCWKQVEEPGWEGFLNSECVWMQMWVELHGDAEVADYQSYLDAYVAEQKALGRFPRPMNNLLSPVAQHLKQQRVVDESVYILLVLALLFLMVCLLNTIGLLLAKVMRRSGEISLRRAVGASRGNVFTQYVVEAGLIGFVGGLLGIGATKLGLYGIDRLYTGDESIQKLLQMNWTMVWAAILLAVISAVTAAIYPTWRVSRIQPASQLKTL